MSDVLANFFLDAGYDQIMRLVDRHSPIPTSSTQDHDSQSPISISQSPNSSEILQQFSGLAGTESRILDSYVSPNNPTRIHYSGPTVTMTERSEYDLHGNVSEVERSVRMVGASYDVYY